MEQFELYLIDMMKEYADKVRNESNEDIQWMEKCVLGELMEAFTQYQLNKNTCDI